MNIGAYTVIGDRAVITTSPFSETDPLAAVDIGDYVIVGACVRVCVKYVCVCLYVRVSVCISVMVLSVCVFAFLFAWLYVFVSRCFCVHLRRRGRRVARGVLHVCVSLPLP